LANVWVYTQRDVTSGRKSDARKDDGRSESHNARAALNLGTRVEVGGALCSWPITSAEAPSLPPLTPDAPLQPPFPVKIFSRISAKNHDGSLLLTCSHATRNDLFADSVFLCFMQTHCKQVLYPPMGRPAHSSLLESFTWSKV